jgi:hypothetical protein
MAKSPEEIRLEKLIQDYKDLTGKKIEFKLQGAQDVLNAIDQISDAIDAAKSRASSLKDSFSSIKSVVEDMLDELRDVTTEEQKIERATKNAGKALNDYKKSVEKLVYDQDNIYKLTKEQVIVEKQKQAVAIDRIKQQAITIIQEKGLKDLTNDQLSARIEELKASGNLSQSAEEILRAHADDYKVLKESLSASEKLVEVKRAEEKELRKSLGIAGALLGTLGKIPIAGEAAKEAYEKIRREAEAIQEAGGKIPTRWQNFKKVLSETGSIIKEKLTDPLFVLTGLATILIKGFNKFDQAVVGVQKRLALSREEATKLVQEFTTFNSLLSSADQLKSIGAIQDKLGSVGKVTKDTAETFGRLNTFVGLSEEAAAGFAAQADAFGKKASSNYTTAVKTTAQIGKQYKTQMDHKAVLETVGKSSAYTLVQFKGSTQALTEGVAKSKALGISLETVNKSASGLLNFQQSIEDELAAELITGKQLNLEQARYYALTNQQSKLMDELNGQIGTYSDFTQQTVLAQEAQAKALGMSVEDLSDMLFKQEYMKNTAQEQVLTEAEAIKQRIEQITLAEKLQKATDKIAETFANLVAGPLGDFLTSVKGIYTLIGAISGALMGKFISQTIIAIGLNRTLAALTRQEAVNSIAGAAADGASSAAKIPGVGWALALPAALAIAGGLVGLLAADDLFSPGGGSGYGKRTLLAPEGAFALNDKDNIIATTNPIRANDLMSTGAGNISVSPAPQTTVVRTAVELNGRKIGNIESIQGPAWGGPRQNGGRIDYSA